MKVSEPLVGVGVIILRNGQVLLGRRKGSHGAGSWALPGGHLEFGEEVEECARREALEETGLVIHHVRRGPYSTDLFPEQGKHYVTLFVVAEAPEGEAEVKEPEKCEGWDWFAWDALPEPLFLPLESLRRRGYRPT